MAQSRSALLPLLAIVAAIIRNARRLQSARRRRMHKSDEPPAPAVNVEWTKFVDEFIEAYFAANPTFAVGSGPPRVRRPAAGLERRKASRRRSRGSSSARAARRRLPGRRRSSPEERFQRDYVVSRIDNDLFWLRDARAAVHQSRAGTSTTGSIRAPTSPCRTRRRTSGCARSSSTRSRFRARWRRSRESADAAAEDVHRLRHARASAASSISIATTCRRRSRK